MARWSQADIDQMSWHRGGRSPGLAAPKTAKYRNRKTIIDGIEFDSQAEADRYRELCFLAATGMIEDLQRQVKFVLVPTLLVGGQRARGISYIADFTYKSQGNLIIEDVKGFRTKTYKIKRILMKHLLGLEIVEV